MGVSGNVRPGQMPDYWAGQGIVPSGGFFDQARKPRLDRRMKLSLGLLAGALMASMHAAMAAAPPTPVPMTGYKTKIADAGLGVAIALPLVATGITIFKHDRAGSAELLVGTVLSLATAYALNNTVREERPDDSSFHSFPAEETALAASSSSFLLERYGWRYGLPYFAASGFVSYSLTQARKEHWYDTLTSSAISAGYSLVVTRPLKSRYNITTRLSASPGGGFASIAYNW
jgi:hypothetical protein